MWRREAEPLPEATVNCIMDAIKMGLDQELPLDVAEVLAHGLSCHLNHGACKLRVIAAVAAPRNYSTLLRIINDSAPRTGLSPHVTDSYVGLRVSHRVKESRLGLTKPWMPTDCTWLSTSPHT